MLTRKLHLAGTLSLSLYICIYIYIHTYIHTYTYIHIYKHTHTHGITKWRDALCDMLVPVSTSSLTWKKLADWGSQIKAYKANSLQGRHERETAAVARCWIGYRWGFVAGSWRRYATFSSSCTHLDKLFLFFACQPLKRSILRGCFTSRHDRQIDVHFHAWSWRYLLWSSCVYCSLVSYTMKICIQK